MPELPEVETIRRGLSKFILQKKLIDTKILCPKSFIGAPVRGTVVEIRRFGKALVIDLDKGYSLLIHLRMTGQLIYDSNQNAGMGNTSNPSRYAAGHPSDNFTAKLPNQQTRVILVFDQGVLYFNDQRKFGFIKVMATHEVEKDSFVSKLAKEPWHMTADELYEKLQRHKGTSIKAALLDQTIICGLGNIYADETLFVSSVHPLRKSGSITREEVNRILCEARKVMDVSIDSGGSTMATYVRADGTKGDYLEKFAQVFRRDGQPCPRCGHTIIKIRAAGRGTHLCPHCQRRQDD